MSRKSVGINAERELIHLFWSSGWSAVRIAGSGSSHYPSPDLIASNIARKLAIEAKVTKDKINAYLRLFSYKNLTLEETTNSIFELITERE